MEAAVDSRTLWGAVIEACFYGHLFYGVCAVAQVLETSVQLALPINGWLAVGSFIGTVLFYIAFSILFVPRHCAGQPQVAFRSAKVACFLGANADFRPILRLHIGSAGREDSRRISCRALGSPVGQKFFEDFA